MPFVRRASGATPTIELVDDGGSPIAVVTDYLAYLAARGCSPNTATAYAHDLRHFWRFLSQAELAWEAVSGADAIGFLAHLRTVSSRARAIRRGPVGVLPDGRIGLSPATINRALAAVSSFYDWAVITGRTALPNPIGKVADRAALHAADRHRPFLEGIDRGQPMRRTLGVRMVRRVPRPLSDDQISALLAALRSSRDLAIVLLMLHGGLRPGEALGLHLEDVAYGRRRVVVRHRDDHPRGVRAKSRTERVVDLHEPATLAAVTAYVMEERPREAATPLVFLVGGQGARRCEPLSYAALAKLFARACERAGIRAPWVTPHALRHTHATKMWEGGMRELALMRRLGHASPESTRMYTRVSDPIVVAEYRRALGMTAPESA